MKHLLSSLLVLASMSVTSFAHAQQAKVIKVKGQQAIVQFPNGVPPVVGEMIPVGGEAQTETGVPTARGSRKHSLGLQASIAFTNNSVDSTSTTGFDVLARYGWNQEIFEYGPLGHVIYSSTTGKTELTLVGGGFLDFNFVPNKPGTVFVYGVGGTADAGQFTRTVAGSATSNSILDLFAGGNMKWFGLSDNVALRADGGFQMTRTTVNGAATTVSGVELLGGISFYF